MLNNIDNNHYFNDLFEARLSEFTGAPFVVLTDSCTNAIFLSLMYLKWYQTPVDTVTIPKQTYVGVLQAILNAGADVVFEDNRWVGQYQLDGTPIIDAAVGFTRNMYSQGMVCLSFQQKKALSVGKGGAILLNGVHAYTTLKRMAWDGRDASKPVHDDMEHIIPGFHMNMTPDTAAMGVLKLNGYAGDKIRTYADYPDISQLMLKGRK